MHTAAARHLPAARSTGELHRFGPNCATWLSFSFFGRESYQRPELGPRFGPTLCDVRLAQGFPLEEEDDPRLQPDARGRTPLHLLVDNPAAYARTGAESALAVVACWPGWLAEDDGGRTPLGALLASALLSPGCVSALLAPRLEPGARLLWRHWPSDSGGLRCLRH